jgi:hypothetical protein
MITTRRNTMENVPRPTPCPPELTDYIRATLNVDEEIRELNEVLEKGGVSFDVILKDLEEIAGNKL